jgi:dipeptidyl aminopeptidase/acylaminoacyl peptidase
MIRRSIRLFSLALLITPAVTIAQSKPAVLPKDYGQWESLGAATLAPNGQWLAYGVNRVSEQNELRIRGTTRDTSYVVPFGTGAVWASNSAWIAYTIGVSPTERERLEKEKKPIKNSVGFRNVATGAETVVADVASFRFSADGRFLSMRRTPLEGKKSAELLIQDLAKGTRLTFGNVSDDVWSEARAMLAFTVETEGGAGNGVQLYDASTGVVKTLDATSSLYRGLTWRPKSDDLAVLRTRVDKMLDNDFRDTTHVVLAWSRLGSPAPVARVLDPATSPGWNKDMRVAEHRRPEWSRDGDIVFIGLRPRVPSAAKKDSMPAVYAAGVADSAKSKGQSSPADKISDVQVWHARDVRIMPMQKVQETQDLQRTLLTAWHLADSKVVTLGSDLQEMVRPLEGAKYATETDRKPYPFGTMFGRSYQDVYLIDVKSGARKKALEKVRYFIGASPTGRKLAWYDGKDYWTQDIATRARVNLSAKIDAKFADPDFDYPSDLTPYSGVAGWTKGDGALLVYDEYDVWSLAPDGSGGRKLTDGAAEKVVHRFARVRRDDDGIDATKPIYLSLFGKRSKKTGYARLTSGAKAPERLVFEDARVIRLQRADSTDTFAFTRERFDDAPDWFVGGPTLADAKQRSSLNAFQSGFAWGRSELVDFTSSSGRPLQAALYYPANYDAAKKYPMIVYTYELLSQGVHNYVVPTERSYYDFSVWTANGYFVLTPDIVFRGRDPGISVLEAVEPAVRTITARGVVDSTKVGIVGHSWGGYEATFLPTRTNMFAASVAGAPITNFLSFAGAIHWTPGIAEFDHWETGQARMDVPPWEDVDAYLRNSPIAKVQDLKTPMLMEVGDADGTVDWHQGIEFYNFARRAGKENFVLLVYPGEDHGLRKKENQIDYHRRINQWFGHWLKGEPAPKWMRDGYPWLDRRTALDANK